MTQLAGWEKTNYGLVLGRFQPLHFGHMEYLAAAWDKSDHLVVGITNPNTHSLIYDGADPMRSRSENNPFSFFDRHQMITASLLETGWGQADFSIVPAPINSPQEMLSYVPPPGCTTVFVTSYDEWGDRKAELIGSLGYSVEVLWRRRKEDRITSGTDIRQAIRQGGSFPDGHSWREVVPGAVARYLEQSGWTARLGKRDI